VVVDPKHEPDADMGAVLEDLAERYEEIWKESAELRARVTELEEQAAASGPAQEELEELRTRTEELERELAAHRRLDRELRARAVDLERELTEYRVLDQELRDAVIAARSAAQQAGRSAEERIGSARLEAEDIVRVAEERRRALEEEIARREQAVRELDRIESNGRPKPWTLRAAVSLLAEEASRVIEKTARGQTSPASDGDGSGSTRQAL
jgi:hypothetical protein